MDTSRRPDTDEPSARREDTAPDPAHSGAHDATPDLPHPAARVVHGIVGGVLVMVGVVLLVLPGPGLLLVLAGLILLSHAVPAVAHLVEPVRRQALQAAEASVSAWWRIAGTVAAGLALVGAGLVWGLRLLPWLPFLGWSTGASLILSGCVVFALMIWSYRRMRGSGH